MGFVNRNQPDIKTGQGGHHPFRHQPFGGQIKNGNFTGGNPSPDRDVNRTVLAGMNGFCRDAGQLQGSNLILHQGDQW